MPISLTHLVRVAWRRAAAVLLAALCAVPLMSGDSGASAQALTLASDSFARSSADAWGTAEAGGHWTTVGRPWQWSVTPGAGRVDVAANSEERAYLAGVHARDVDIVTTLVLPRSTQANRTYAYVLGRYVEAYNPSYYRVGAGQGTGGSTVVLRAQRSDGGMVGTDADTGIPAAAGAAVRLRVQFDGANPTTIRARAWLDGSAEPSAWMLTATDSTSAHQVPGAVGLRFKNEDTSATHAFVARGLVASGSAVATPAQAPNPTGPLARRYLYVLTDGNVDVFDMDSGHAPVKHIDVPTAGPVGVAVDAASGMMWISECGSACDPPSQGGQLLKYNLLTDTVEWIAYYPFAVDSHSVSRDGTRIYAPDHGVSSNGMKVLDARSGEKLADIAANVAGHNSIVSPGGDRVYLGGWAMGADLRYLHVIDPATNAIIKKVGPLRSGVRPFSVNAAGTLAYTTASDFLGFEVSSLVTGQLLYTVPVAGFPTPGCITNSPSHGISLSPDENEVYVVDCPNSYVHVFDVSGVPASPPMQMADIPLSPIEGFVGGCASRCGREGWLLHSADGRFVYVGDAGDVIDTATRTIVAHVDELADTRKVIEVDWRDGHPFFTTGRSGLGYAGEAAYGLDSDGDRCMDFEEYDEPAVLGGGRDPHNGWDFFDVTGDARVDLTDVLVVLAHFGHGPASDNLDPGLERYIPDQTQPHRTAWATGQRAGITLEDALAVLPSFGHSCTPPP